MKHINNELPDLHLYVNLIKIDLSENKIHKLNDNMFDNNINLIYLYLNNNNLIELPVDLLKYNINLI